MIDDFKYNGGNPIVRRILEKFFGADHPKIEYAVGELDMLIDDPLGKSMQEQLTKNSTKTYKPAYQNADDDNLVDGCCYHCKMVWYNCLCSHDND